MRPSTRFGIHCRGGSSGSGAIETASDAALLPRGPLGRIPPSAARADRAVRNVGFRTRHSIVTIPGPFGGRARGEGSQGMGLACLRISGTKERYVPVPDGEWTPLAFDFHIEDELADIELICEFQSQSGTASFDETSLRLVRE